MHKLTRGKSPDVLEDFDPEKHDWDTHFKSKHKRKVWDELIEMQGYYCAYCECSLDMSDPEETHIEHFRQKGRTEYHHLTFEWTNLFGSCCHRERCGCHKDKSGISSEDIIKMDEEDPEKYFLFISTGAIHVRDGLSVVEKTRAELTLRAFNLNPRRGGVKNDRERVIKTHYYLFKEMIDMVNDVKEESDMDFLIEIRDAYIEKIVNRPFITAIKHVLVSNWETAI